MRRRGILAAGATVLPAGLAGCTRSACPPAERSFDDPRDRWPTVGYDPAATGHAPAAPGSSSERWRVERGSTDPPLYGVLSTPLVADGTVYVAVSDERGDRDEPGLLAAFDAGTGDTRWTVEFPAGVGTREGRGVGGGPALAGGTVLVGTRDGTLRAVGTDGTRRWSVDLGGVPGTPTTYGDRVYVPTSTGGVAALTVDGERCWTVSGNPLRGLFDDPPPIRTTVPAVDDSGVYVAFGPAGAGAPARLEAYGHGGRRRWRYEAPAGSPGGLGGVAVDGGAAYVTLAGDVHAVDAGSGERRWRFATGADAGGPPATDGVRVYAGCKNLYALDPGDGSERWRVVNGALPGEDGAVPYLGRPAVADGAVHVRAGAVDAIDGTRRWGGDADAAVREGDHFTDHFWHRPLVRPAVTADALYLSHAIHGVVKYA